MTGQRLKLEVMQCGLSWNLMIEKREIFRECFDGFDFRKVAEYKEADIRRILEYPEMINAHHSRCFCYRHINVMTN